MSYFLASLWFITLLIASYFYERLRKAETLAQWEKRLRQGPNLSSLLLYFGDDSLEAWNTNLLETLKTMRRNQWVSKEEFRDMREQLSFRYSLIKGRCRWPAE
jgi:hypothetical protein